MVAVLAWLDKHFEALLISILLVGITVLCTLQVVLRYCFSNSLSWVEEVVVYCNVWIGFIGCSYAVLRDNSLRVDLGDFITKKYAVIVKAAGDAIAFGFYIYIAYCGIEVLQRLIASGQVSPGAEIPISVLYASLCVGAVLAVLRYMQRAYRFIMQIGKHTGA
jgi:TRAP-type C4-dicarboxylate transport system permease small subunit